jgi:hypothetical protein
MVEHAHHRALDRNADDRRWFDDSHSQTGANHREGSHRRVDVDHLLRVDARLFKRLVDTVPQAIWVRQSYDAACREVREPDDVVLCKWIIGGECDDTRAVGDPMDVETGMFQWQARNSEVGRTCEYCLYDVLGGKRLHVKMARDQAWRDCGDGLRKNACGQRRRRRDGKRRRLAQTDRTGAFPNMGKARQVSFDFRMK